MSPTNEEQSEKFARAVCILPDMVQFTLLKVSDLLSPMKASDIYLGFVGVGLD